MHKDNYMYGGSQHLCSLLTNQEKIIEVDQLLLVLHLQICNLHSIILEFVSNFHKTIIQYLPIVLQHLTLKSTSHELMISYSLKNKYRKKMI